MLQDLRSELENLISINNDIRQTRLQKAKNKEDAASTMMNTTMTKSIFSETKNASFLNQELAMFIGNLHQKATQVGLKEDALIPQENKKERQIYQSVRSSMSRPQSAFTGGADAHLDESASNTAQKKRRENSPTQTAMRSSFYSMSLLNDDERQEIMNDANMEADSEAIEYPKRFQAEQQKRGAVVDQLNIKNILELSQRDKEVLQQIKNFMTQQESELQQEITVMQRLMLEQATQ